MTPLSHAIRIVRKHFDILNTQAPLTFTADIEKLIYIDIDCEIQQSIAAYERLAHMCDWFAQVSGYVRDFQPKPIEVVGSQSEGDGRTKSRGVDDIVILLHLYAITII